jgi:hypothetical protein
MRDLPQLTRKMCGSNERKGVRVARWIPPDETRNWVKAHVMCVSINGTVSGALHRTNERSLRVFRETVLAFEVNPLRIHRKVSTSAGSGEFGWSRGSVPTRAT